MAVSFSGSFAVYAVNANRTVTKLFAQSLLAKTPNGVYCAEIDAKCEYLVMGSFASSSSNGLSIWRVLDQEPWITQFETVPPQETQRARKNFDKMKFSKIVSEPNADLCDFTGLKSTIGRST